MTVSEFERNWLSLRVWVRRCLLPAALALVLLMLMLKLVGPASHAGQHSALLIGFFVTYFVLVRGGHLIMVRSLHFELKTKYTDDYAKALSHLPKNLSGINIGFTLARIKRALIEAKETRKREIAGPD